MKTNKSRSPTSSDHSSPGHPEKACLPFAAVIPGLLFILFVDIATVLDLGGAFQAYLATWSLIIAILPWGMLLLFRQTPTVFGYTRKRGLAIFGWGMLAGAIWRGLSMAFLYWVQSNGTQVGWHVIGLVGMLFWIPFVEETFFRGYLGASLVRKFGRWPGILTQAVLFSLHPAHWRQGLFDVLSIFAFGLLTGWLYNRHRSIWAPWGAHALANVLPYILRGLVV